MVLALGELVLFCFRAIGLRVCLYKRFSWNLSHKFQVNSSFSLDIGIFWSFRGIQVGFNGHFRNPRQIPKFLDEMSP